MIKPAEPGRWLALTLGAFFLLTAALGLASRGVYQDDDLAHFLFARWAGWFPSYLLHVWGRPGLTIPLFAVSWLGPEPPIQSRGPVSPRMQSML